MRMSATILMTAALVAGVTLLTGVEFGTAAEPQPGPRSCDTATFHIETVPSVGDFPTTDCADANNPGRQCVDYGYLVKTRPTGARINKSIFAVSVDQDVHSTYSTPGSVPPAVVSAPGAGESTTQFLQRSRHEYTVRFTAPTPTVTSFEAHMRIVAPSTPRTTTVLMRSLSGALESCLIAGPGVQGVQIEVDPFKPQLVQQDVVCAAGGCMCHLNFDAAGNIVSVTADSLAPRATCAVTLSDQQFFIDLGDGQPAQPIQHFEQITSGTGTCTTYNTKPKKTTICR